MESTPNTHILNIAIVFCYLFLMIGVGIAFRTFNKNIGDYFKSGSQASWWLVGASMFMSSFSASAFTGSAGVAFEAGWSVVALALGGMSTYLLHVWFLGPWFRQIRATTGPEVLKLRFSEATCQFFGYVTVVFSLLWAGIGLYAVAVFCSAVFGYPIFWTIIGLGAVVIIYSTAGGSWAVMATDFLQGLIMIPLTIAVAVLAFIKIGGIDGLFTAIEAQGLTQDFQMINESGRFSGEKFTLFWFMAIFVKKLCENSTLGSAVRYFAVKDGREARKAAMLAICFFALGMVTFNIPPMVARLVYESQVMAMDIPKPAEAAYAIASFQLLPAGLTGLMVVVVFVATMSTVDTGINRNSAIMIRDLLPVVMRLIRRPLPSDRMQLVLGKILSVMLGIGVVSMAVYFSNAQDKGVFEIMLDLSAVISLPFVMPTVLSLFIRRVPQSAGIVTAVLTCIPSGIGFFSGELFGDPWSFQTKVFVNIVFGTLFFLATKPFWKYSSEAFKQQEIDFFERMYTPVDFEKEVGAGSDNSQLHIVGLFAMAMGGLISLMIFLPNPWSGRFVILCVSGFIFLTGAAMYFFGRKKNRAHESGDPVSDLLSKPVDMERSKKLAEVD